MRRAAATWAGPALAALAGAGVTALATRQGVGVAPDSLSYLDAAGHVARGMGVRVGAGAEPLTKFPPGYPLVLGGWLAAGQAFGEVSAAGAARSLQVLLAAANAALLARLAAAELPASRWRPAVALGAGLWLLVPPGPAEGHVMALSEGLSLTLTLLWLTAAVRWVRRPSLGWLAALAAVGAAAPLVRFAGASLALTAATVILLRPGRPWGRRAAEALGQGVVAAVPVLLWIWSRAEDGGIGGSGATTVAIDHGWGLHAVRALPRTLGQALWPWPDAGAWPVLYVVPAVAAMGYLLWRRGKPQAEPSPTVAVALQLVAVYVAFVWAAAVAADPYLRLDRRLAIPVLVGGLLAVGVAAGRRSAPAGLLVWVLAAAPGVVPAAWAYGQWAGEGMYYNHVRLRASAGIERVRGLDGPLWADAPGVVHFLTGRRAAELPTFRGYNANADRLAMQLRRAAAEAGLAGGGHYVQLRYRRTATLERLARPTLREVGAEVAYADDEVVIHRFPAAGGS